jgi:HEAT repeat protein
MIRMTIPTYPFDDHFRLLVEEQSDWWCLINAKDQADQELFENPFVDAGYSKEQVRGYLKALKELPIDELVDLALRVDSDESPALIVLQHRPSRDVFDKAIQLCANDNPKDRVLGVEIVMRQPGLHFRSEALTTVCHLAKVETDSGVLEVLAFALYHLDVDNLSEYLQRMATNPAAATREAVASCLSLSDDDLAVRLLIDLSADENGGGRNWATFGLQPLNKGLRDRQEIRDALYARVHDSHEEARHEALVGLAQYKDARVIAPLIDALCAESVWALAVEAAQAIGNPELYPHLTKLRAWWDVDPELLERAIAACAPIAATDTSTNARRNGAT